MNKNTLLVIILILLGILGYYLFSTTQKSTNEEQVEKELQATQESEVEIDASIDELESMDF